MTEIKEFAELLLAIAAGKPWQMRMDGCEWKTGDPARLPYFSPLHLSTDLIRLKPERTFNPWSLDDHPGGAVWVRRKGASPIGNPLCEIAAWYGDKVWVSTDAWYDYAALHRSFDYLPEGARGPVLQCGTESGGA